MLSFRVPWPPCPVRYVHRWNFGSIQRRARSSARSWSPGAEALEKKSQTRSDSPRDAIRPVYPLETAIGVVVAGIAGGSVAASRAAGVAVLRQIMPNVLPKSTPEAATAGEAAEKIQPPRDHKTSANSAGLTRPQLGSIGKIDNIIQNGAKAHDFLGVTKEIRGEVTGYDHVTEMKNDVRGLRDAISSIQGSLNNPNLSPAARSELAAAATKGQNRRCAPETTDGLFGCLVDRNLAWLGASG